MIAPKQPSASGTRDSESPRRFLSEPTYPRPPEIVVYDCNRLLQVWRRDRDEPAETTATHDSVVHRTDEIGGGDHQSTERKHPIELDEQFVDACLLVAVHLEFVARPGDRVEFVDDKHALVVLRKPIELLADHDLPPSDIRTAQVGGCKKSNLLF